VDDRITELKTAGYYELVARAQELGLPVTGGVPELRARVAQAMGLTLPPDDKTPGRTLSIDTAEQAGLISVEAPAGGKLLRLTGGLQVTLVDNDKKVTHIIEAGELWYDQANEEMTARGNVVYTIIRENSREVFKGESLTFQLSDSQGVFYQGASERARVVGDQTLTFRYGGEAIRRSSGDMVVLDTGTITSSLGADPYYRIRAKKIWVLAPGEWGLQDAVLYLGRVPVLYFPFFFQPGDDFWFNPVLSFPDAGDRRGTSLQTTTYIFGKKIKDQSPLSFLQVADSTQTEDKVIHGLFLVRGTPPDDKIPKDWTFKLMNDFYSNLGYLSSADANLPNFNGMKTFHAFAGLGFTRTVDANGLPYSVNPFQAELDPWAQSDWNSSRFGPWTVPFRYGGLFAVDSGWGNASLEYYSDPLLYNDLTANRSENFSVFSLLGMGPAKTTAVATEKTSLNWSAGVNTPPVTAGGSLLWSTSTATETLRSGDPRETFYVPSQLTLPQVSVALSGTLWPLVTAKATDKQASALIPPSGTDKTAPEAAAAAPTPGLIAPGLMDALALGGNDRSWTTGVTWSLAPTIKTDSRFDNSATQSFDRNSWTPLSSRWSGSYDGKLALATGWSDTSWTTTEALTLHQQKQDTWYLEKGTDPTTYDQEDEAQTSSLFSQAFATAWKPWFSSFRPLRDSSVQYSLASNLWKQTSTVTQGADWSKKSVTTHQAAATGVWYIIEGLPTIKATAGWQDNLPPLDRLTTYNGQLDLSTPWATASTSAAARYSDAGWAYDPWQSTAAWTPLADFSLSQLFQYDLKNQYPLLATSTLKAWGFSTQYSQQRTTAYSYDTTARNWVAGGQGFYPQQLLFSYNLDLPPIDWWYHRNILSAKVAATWPINLQQYSQMPLTINYTVAYKVMRFLDFQVTEGISNQTPYRYFPWLADSFGPGAVRQVNVFQDLWDSISIWDQAALKRTSFKMTNLTVGMIHYLDDWQVKLDYTGSPQLKTVGSILQYQWTGTLTLTVAWYPIPELKTQMQVDNTGLQILRNTPEPTTSTPAATQ
jgi:lipopolysaccharide assembly outer membrane protein LptD (OstA)